MYNKLKKFLIYSFGNLLSTYLSPVLDIELISLGLAIDTVNLAFKAGSSKQGNAFLASVG